MRITRREFAALGTGALVARSASAQNIAAPLITRAIPRTGERIPANLQSALISIQPGLVANRRNGRHQIRALSSLSHRTPGGAAVGDRSPTYLAMFRTARSNRDRCCFTAATRRGPNPVRGTPPVAPRGSFVCRR